MIFAICGPSGVGKGTLIRNLVEQENRVIFCRNWTNRPVRNKETDEYEYYFTDSGTILSLREQDDLIGGDIKQYGFLYGIRISEIEGILMGGHSVLVEANLDRIRQLRERFEEVIAIFIAPPSITALAERLHHRKRESEEEIALRLSESIEMIYAVNAYLIDYYVVNADIQSCLNNVRAIVDAEHHRLQRGILQPQIELYRK